jgi:hypothetical protein
MDPRRVLNLNEFVPTNTVALSKHSTRTSDLNSRGVTRRLHGFESGRSAFCYRAPSMWKSMSHICSAASIPWTK